jgi:hypothetical protein
MQSLGFMVFINYLLCCADYFSSLYCGLDVTSSHTSANVLTILQRCNADTVIRSILHAEPCVAVCVRDGVLRGNGTYDGAVTDVSSETESRFGLVAGLL